MKEGRPTSYSADMLKRAKFYVDNYKDLDDVVPTIAGLADYLNVHRDTIYEWAKHDSKQEFSDTIRKIDAKRERALVNGGLSGVLNPTITKLMMASLGYSEKQDINHQSSDGSMTPTVIERVIIDKAPDTNS